MENQAVGFYYTDLGEPGDDQRGRPFDGMTHGHFVDMWGTSVDISRRDLEVYVKNTRESIAASTTESGEVVGLPIDCVAHERGNAAGWIVDVELVGEVIQFTPVWTDLGKDLIRRKLQRLFSPTLDLTNKSVRGGSLTNWPATRDKKGRVLIRPIELSENPDGNMNPLTYQVVIDAEEKETGNDDQQILEKGQKQMTPEEVQALINEKLQGAVGELTLNKDQISDLIGSIRQQITAEMEAESKRILHETAMVNLASQLVKGTAEMKRGLPVDEAELAQHLKLLPSEESEFWSKTLQEIQKSGVVDFTEIGNNSDKGQGHRQLPEIIVEKLNTGELKFSDLSDPILGLGDLSEYDLTKWNQKS